jgi:hypothetical protein
MMESTIETTTAHLTTNRKATPAEAACRFLQAKGFDTRVDSDGDVVFYDDQRRVYFYILSPSDGTCQSLVFPRFWSIDSDRDFLDALHAAADVNSRFQLVKICPCDEDVSARVDMFCPDQAAFHEVFDDLLGALQAGVKNFARTMRGMN